MGTKPSSVSVANYNDNPPPDNGSTGVSNKPVWAVVKSEIGDPVKTAVEDINTGMVNVIGTTYSRSSNSNIVAANYSDFIICSGTFSQTFAASSALGANWRCYIVNKSTGIVTLTPNGAETINGSGSLKLFAGAGGMVTTDGSNLSFVSEEPTASHKIVSFSHSGTTQIVSGIGFKPRAVVLFSCAQYFFGGITGGYASYGMYDGTNNFCVYDSRNISANTYTVSSSKSIVVYWWNNAVGATGVLSGHISSVNDDGFTVTWDSTTGSVDVKALCFL